MASLRFERRPARMNPDQFRRLGALYDAAAGLGPADRGRFIDESCADDEEVRCELLAAFVADDGRSGLTGLVERAAAAAVGVDAPWTGRRLGPYRVVRPLGQGGMGAVSLAVRDDAEFHKQVAIKTLKFELDSGSAVARFRHERQILAHLEHPNIARLLDGGTTEHGTPYIVLEFVDGLQIAEWCQQRRLMIDDRLRLFCQVCDAVQYAHQHLIVHRDIKPGNILVTSDGVPKLLDFGIAKLLDGAALAGLHTMQTSGPMMTPDYVSPEQVRGQPVSTATDVYGLGAVLYELLTNTRPHELRTYDPAEIARVVCETDVRPPSAMGNRHLRGDLDTIVLKAMQKEPSRRYSSVTALTEDIRRYVEGLPVAARPDTAIYRATKFVRRHRLGVVATVAVVVSLAIGVALALNEARVAERRFAQVRELSNTFLFQFYDQVTPLPGSTAVRASIVDTARKYLDGLSKEARGDKELTLELAAAYGRLGDVQGRTGTANLGQLDDARRSYQRAIDLYVGLPVTASSAADLRRRLANALLAYGRLEYNAYHEDVAERFTRRMLDILSDGAAEPATRMLQALGSRSLADIFLRQGHTADALGSLEFARRTLLDLQAVHYDDARLPAEIASTRERLARARVYAGDLDGAAVDFQALLQDTPACTDENPAAPACRTLAVRLIWTGDVYAAVDRPNLHDPAKAAPLYERAVHIRERQAALDDHDRQVRFDLAASYGKLGDAVWESDPKRALDLYDRALGTAKTLASKEQLEILKDSYLQAISRPLIALHRLGEAQNALGETLKRAKTDSTSQYDDQLTEAFVKTMWCRLLRAEGKPDAARLALDQVIHDLRVLQADHRDSLETIADLSDAYRLLASITSGAERRDAFLKSAAAWHSWPPTSFTRREEQRDLDAAGQ
jgi:eukaryotic-like serine/threonine-protein kinase